MAKIVSIHSFRGGTGKSNTTANVATAIAMLGHRVAVIDSDIQSPGIHVPFGVENDTLKFTLNDYLWDNCAIAECAYEVSSAAVKQGNGTIYLIPSSSKAGDITRVLKEGYDVRLLRNGLRDLVKDLNLDFVFVDTHPGLNEETLLSIAISNILIVILRPDRQDFQGTAVTLDLAQKLKVPKILLVINRVLQNAGAAEVRQQVEAKYGIPVAAVMPNCDEMMQLGSSDLFYLRYPDHPLSQEIKAIAQQVIH
jgi:MinD-like ATPase involved in chromosome partitioning or flagellar assembly